MQAGSALSRNEMGICYLFVSRLLWYPSQITELPMPHVINVAATLPAEASNPDNTDTGQPEGAIDG